MGAHSIWAFDLVLWRGETRAVILPDNVEAESVTRGGYALRLGALETVKYAPAPRSLQRLEVYDRVVWEGAVAVHAATSPISTRKNS